MAKFTRRLIITNTTWNVNDSTLIIETSEPHYLVTGDQINIYSNLQELKNISITYISATSFSIVGYQNYVSISGTIESSSFGTGQTGRFVLKVPHGTRSSFLVQSFVTGVGGATYAIEASLDSIHWVKLIDVTHPGLDGDSDFTVIDALWESIAINITSIGSNTKLEVLYSI